MRVGAYHRTIRLMRGLPQALIAAAALSTANLAYAQALPESTVVSPQIANAVNGVVAIKAQQRGFAANDPVISATSTVLGGAIGTIAGAVIGTGLAALSAPAWLVVGAVAL